MIETYELYRYVFIIGAILSGVFLLLSVILFFVLRIPQVIGNLSGSTARKAIQKLREENERGEGRPQGAGHNVSTGELDGGSSRKKSIFSGQRARAPETSLLEPGDETTILMDGDETTILNGDETSVLASGGETARLSQQDAPPAFAPPAPVPAPSPAIFSVDFDITFIHTDEIIR